MKFQSWTLRRLLVHNRRKAISHERGQSPAHAVCKNELAARQHISSRVTTVEIPQTRLGHQASKKTALQYQTCTTRICRRQDKFSTNFQLIYVIPAIQTVGGAHKASGSRSAETRGIGRWSGGVLRRVVGQFDVEAALRRHLVRQVTGKLAAATPPNLPTTGLEQCLPATPASWPRFQFSGIGQCRGEGRLRSLLVPDLSATATGSPRQE
jgi:hypothetical protein